MALIRSANISEAFLINIFFKNPSCYWYILQVPEIRYHFKTPSRIYDTTLFDMTIEHYLLEVSALDKIQLRTLKLHPTWS